ncbi:MAG: hypothetical protein KF712_10585 [Akkermansiaceae bacterium]|nr:hypothetical protein [Akkermansiaceae bacterium]
MKNSPFHQFVAAFTVTLTGFSSAALTDNFDTYPNGGTGWAAGWVESETNGTPAGNARVDGSLLTTSPLNGGGSYLSVTTAVQSTTMGIRRNMGSTAASPYTLTFDWRLDSSMSNFTHYNDRIHIGATSGTGAADFGSNLSFAWLIGVVGADDTANSNPFNDGEWYFYNNQSTTANGAFNTNNMTMTGIQLAQDVIYSFTVTVDPTAQTYRVIMTDGTATFDSASVVPGGMNFRNQVNAGSTASTLVFGGATNSTADQLTWSLDNLNIIPEPSSAFLAALSGLLCFVRRRIVH